MQKYIVIGLTTLLFLAACSENDEEVGEKSQTKLDQETAEQVHSESKDSSSTDNGFEGLGEARIGDTYEQFVNAFGEDTSDTDGIGFFQNESIWMNYNDTLVYTVVLHFEATNQVERNKEEVTELIRAILPEDAQFEREESNEAEGLYMLHYTSDQLAAVFNAAAGYTNDNLDYREVRADLVPSEETENAYVGIVFSSH
ncbi:hypothetical protein JCM19046_3366 [Bacillus sp. JCM 19046]|nr:hypothetical protein JCM19045_864 [Bacillus sp. JCM 19045]GAF18773.1 hypothetical protein JCM19046_3366 [Bacillus sp. JCM 19046]